MNRKLELKHDEIGNIPCQIGIFEAKVSDKCYHHYCFQDITISFYDTNYLFQDIKKPNQQIDIKGTAIDDFTFCLKIDEIYLINVSKIFGFVVKYIAENWYTVYKKPWYSKKWKQDKEAEVKIKLLSISGNEALVSFGI